jgi:hypothetical protein
MKILSQAEIDAMLEKLLSDPNILPGHTGAAKTGQTPGDSSAGNDKSSDKK